MDNLTRALMAGSNLESSYGSVLASAEGVPAEMHLYAEGKHGFGIRPTNLPITRWPELVERWVRTIGVIAP
jgi:hypothetical protein